jgi:membrane associated rhomboid family serine protease
LIIANTLVFYAMLAHSIYTTGTEQFLNTRIFENFDSELLRTWGSNFGPLTLSGQFWRVITSMFVHLNFLHLAMNMLFLWGLGRYIDRLFTRTQAFAIYLLTGAACDIFSLGWRPILNSAGASGAIYGQAGVLIALLCFGRLTLSRRDIRNMLLWIIFLMPIELLWSPLSKHTDYAGHIGGILGGLVIGALLAPTFRAPTEQAGRQYRVLRNSAAALVVIFAVVAQARRGAALEYLKALQITSNLIDYSKYSNHPSQVSRVFLDLKGDPKLVRHFSGLLHAELENNGIAESGSAPEADAVVHGEIHTQRERTNLSLGVLQTRVTSPAGRQEISSCASLTTGANLDLFDDLFTQSAANVASQIRAKYPDVRTVRLDPKSDMAASSRFAEELPSALKKSGFSVEQSGPADISVLITLRTQEAPVEKDVAAYDIRAVARNGKQFFASSGSTILFAKSTGDPPAACPERLADLKWLYNNTGLYPVASELANGLSIPQPEHRVNQTPSKTKPGS